MIEKAKIIAKLAHQGQVDKGGYDYFCHLEYVAESVNTESEKIVAYLHDILEDTFLTSSDLKVIGFSDNIIDSVVALTKIQGESYFDYLNRVKQNRIAQVVKIADLKNNMDLSRLSKITEKDIERKNKYEKALELLSTP